jgi:uncharacterized protein
MTTETIERSVKGPADLESLFPGRFLSVTSFKRDGTGVATPLWFVTDRHSPKVRRIRRNPNVLIAPCRANGSLRGQPVAAHAEVLTAEPELERVKTLLLARYAISYRVVMLCYRLGRRLRGRQAVAEGAALAITLDSAPSAVGAPTGR